MASEWNRTFPDSVVSAGTASWNPERNCTRPKLFITKRIPWTLSDSLTLMIGIRRTINRGFLNIIVYSLSSIMWLLLPLSCGFHPPPPTPHHVSSPSTTIIRLFSFLHHVASPATILWLLFSPHHVSSPSTLFCLVLIK